MEHTPVDKTGEEEIPNPQLPDRLLESIRSNLKRYKLAAALSIAIGQTSSSFHPAEAGQPGVARLEKAADVQEASRYALLEALATCPHSELKETWLPMIQSGKMRVDFFMNTDESGGDLATFGLVEKDGKLQPKLKIVAPFLMVGSKDKVSSVLLHEFTHYQQWLKGKIKDEYLIEGRKMMVVDWKEQIGIAFEMEVEAGTTEMNFLDKQHYNGQASEGQYDHQYGKWQQKGHAFAVERAYLGIVRQIGKDPQMLPYLDELKEKYSK